MNQEEFHIHTLVESNMGESFGKEKQFKLTITVALPVEQCDNHQLLSMWFCYPQESLFGTRLNKYWGDELDSEGYTCISHSFFAETIKELSEIENDQRQKIVRQLTMNADKIRKAMMAVPEEATYTYSVAAIF